MRKAGSVLLAVLGGVGLLVILGIVFSPWVSGWLPESKVVEAWISYFVVDLRIGQWGPVVILLTVAGIELIWALNLGRKSNSFERQWDRLERLHRKEIEILDQEIGMLKDERRALATELELYEDIIREDRTRLWAQLEDLQRMMAGPIQSQQNGWHGFAPAILRSKAIAAPVPQLPPDVRGELREIIAQLERIEMIASVTGRKSRSAVQLQQHADELLRLAGACYQLGQYERALGHYNRALERGPNDVHALINRAVVSYELGAYQSALRDLERALKAEESSWAYLYRGLIQERLGEPRRAVEACTRAIRLDPEFVEVYYLRGLLYAKLGEQDRALQDQSRVLELDADYARAHTARGVVRAALGEHERALEDLDKGCILAPRSSEAFYHRGLVRARMEMLKEALDDLKLALELDPQLVAAHLALGDVYASSGDHWQAIDNYDRAIELDAQNVAAYYARGQARAVLREFARAIADYGKVLELDAGRAEVLASRGEAYEKLGEFDRAILDLDRALVLEPGLAVAYYLRGLAYGSKGEYDKASRDLDKAVELDPSLNNKRRGFVGTASA